MLTADEIEELRKAVAWAADGPLTGLLVKLTPEATSYLHGWCHTTRTGAVVANYKAEDC